MRQPSADFDIRDHLAPAGFFGSSANVVMQLGWPGVGHGVAESKVSSGNVLIHPWKRLRTTLSYIVVALLGTESDRAAYREAVNKQHLLVRSGPNSPVKYNAFSRDLQLWVAACLYQGFVDIRTTYLGPLDDRTADDLYFYCSRLGTTLQVTEDDWPEDRATFERYWKEGLEQVRYDPVVRDHLMKVVNLEMVPWFMRIGTARVNRFFTTGFMHAPFREAMGLPWTDKDQRRFDRFNRLFAVVTRLTPKWLRNLGTDLLVREVRFRIKHGWDLT